MEACAGALPASALTRLPIAAPPPPSPATLLTMVGTLDSVAGAASCASVLARSPALAIAVASSAGESCQFQKRVRSIFSAEGQWPSTASPITPRVGSEKRDTGGEKASLWKRVSASCTALLVSGSRIAAASSTTPSALGSSASRTASEAGIENGITMQLP